MRLLVPAALTVMIAASCSSQPNKTLGKIHAGNKLGGEMLHYVRPVYPSWAKLQKITGEVEFRALIAEDGSVKELTPLSGPKELIPYAEAAVRQWRYRPATVNDTPVEIITQIRINFTLSQ
ncbi:MAG: energy transducer TonB [Bryobacteraceae bacterium]|jgi:protein TonB